MYKKGGFEEKKEGQRKHGNLLNHKNTALYELRSVPYRRKIKKGGEGKEKKKRGEDFPSSSRLLPLLKLYQTVSLFMKRGGREEE